MEINLLNPAQFVATTESAVPGATEAVDGDAFARMMAQIGMAPEAMPGMPVVDPATAERAAEPVMAGMLHAASVSPKDEALAPAAPEAEATPASDAAPPLTPTDLPALLAALIAPAPPPAVPVGQAPHVQAATPAAATVIPTATSTVLQSDAIGLRAMMTDLKRAPADFRAEPFTAVAPQPGLSQLARLSVLAGAAAQGGKGAAARASMPAGAEPMPVITVKAEAFVKPVAEAMPLVGPAPAMPIEAAPALAPLEVATAAEPIIEQQLDLARDGEWLDRLAKDIARTANGEGNLRFRLNPEHLGSLHVELTQGASGASVRLTADTEAARTILVDAQPRLMAEARAQGVKIAETHVDLGSQSQSSAGGGQRDGRDLPTAEYFTTSKPSSGEDTSKPPRRSSSERYA